MAPWEKYGGAPQSPQPSAPGVIMGRPKAPAPYQVERDQISDSQKARDDARADIQTNIAVDKGRRDAIEFEQRQEEERIKRQRQTEAASSAANELRAVIADATEAKRLSREGYFATGFGAESAAGFGGTAAADVAALLDTIGGNLAFDKLQRMRDASPTGGALGQVTERELDLLRSSVASLKQSQSDEQFQRNMDRVIEIYGGILSKLEMGQNPASPDTLAQFGRWGAGVIAPQGGQTPTAPPERSMRVPGATMDNIRFDMDGGGSEPVEGMRLSPEQERDYQAFIDANRNNLTPELLNAWWQSRGFGGLANADEVVAAARQGNLGGINYSQTDQQRRDELDAQLREQGEMSYAEGGQAGLDRGLTLGWMDEIAGASGAINSLLTGGSISEGYTRERDLQRRAQEISREKAGVLPELAGGLLVPGGALGQAKTVGQFARQGAAFGGIAGAGEGEGFQGTAANALLGVGTGAALGGALSQAPRAINALLQTQPGQKVANALARPATGNVNREVVEAGQRQNIPIRQPDARPEVRNSFAAVEASPQQSARVRNVLDSDTSQVQSRLREVGGPGTGLDNLSMGESIQGAGQRFIVKSRGQANALYARAQQLSSGARVTPEGAIKAIDDNIAELTANGARGNAGQIRYLEDLRADLSTGELSIDALRSIRTNARGQISERNLTATDAERRIGEVLRAASADIERGLADNPQALAAYKAADRFYQEKQTFIKDVVQKFTGTRNNPLSAEQAASRFQAMMRERGDYKRFSQMLERLEPEERADMAATIAENLGTGRNGEFSLAALATNVGKLNPRALKDLFGEEGAKAIADLKIIARAKADTQSGLNLSKSGVVMAHGNRFKELLLGIIGGGAAGAPGAIGGMAVGSAAERWSSGRSARLLLNPDFTKWLRQTPNSTNPDVINRHFDRLNKIASREQSFLMDAQALQEYLRNVVSQSPSRAAAEGQNVEDRR